MESLNDSGFMEIRSSIAMQILARRASFLNASAPNSPYSSAEYTKETYVQLKCSAIEAIALA